MSADEAVHAEGALVGVSDEIDAAAIRERTEAAQATRLYFAGVASDGSAVTGRQLVRMPETPTMCQAIGAAGWTRSPWRPARHVTTLSMRP